MAWGGSTVVICLRELCRGGGNGARALDPSNMTRGEEGVAVEGSSGNWLGPWILAVHHWLLESEKMVEGGRKESPQG